ncbi:MAG: cell wall-binding repeat-containing protein [Mogibacterium sp.]|nr:cell wall-binding repeat-containing protein [Mogibacterium sp.]
MLKRTKSLIVIIMLAMLVVCFPTSANRAEATTSLSDKNVYFMTGYSSGFCNLSANIWMIRRAMIMRGSDAWTSVNYKSAQKVICSDGWNNLKGSYALTSDGVTVTCSSFSLSGSASSKAAKLRSMLDAHPEGVVVLGRDSYGTHAVLLTGYYGTGDNQFYAVDATYNADGTIKYFSKAKGIQPYPDTSMQGISSVTVCWYLTSISGIATSARNTFVDANGYKYYIDGSGKKMSGLQTIGGKIYYFIPGDCHAARGFYTVDGKKYYFDPSTCAAAVNGTKTISGAKYFFDENGVVRTGWYSTDAGDYYLDDSGAAVGGYAIVDGNPELFDTSTYLHLESNSNLLASNGVDVVHCYGSNRYSTSLRIAEALKYELGVAKFDNIVVASGLDYPDALAGGYLAKTNNAPLILVDSTTEDRVKTYIENNLATGGKVFILGQTGAVSANFENKIKSAGINTIRLGGANRIETNQKVLNETAGEPGSNELLVCSANGYADSISASSTGRPIMLVGTSLNSIQSKFITYNLSSIDKIYIIGGTGAVNTSVESSLKALIGEDKVERIYGANRYSTSAAVAKQFADGTETEATIVWGNNFPDGLSAGPLAAAKNAPIILALSNVTDQAKAAAGEMGLSRAFVIGGPTLITESAARTIISK